MESRDPRIFDLCRPEHSSVAEVWILSKEKSISNDGTDQRGYEEGYQVFFRLCGADEFKNRPKGAIWPHLPSAIIH